LVSSPLQPCVMTAMRLPSAILLLIIAHVVWADPPVSLVRVLKSEHKLQLFAEGKVVREFHVAFGGSPKGHKRQEGDEKTPEGALPWITKSLTATFTKLSTSLSTPKALPLQSRVALTLAVKS